MDDKAIQAMVLEVVLRAKQKSHVTTLVSIAKRHIKEDDKRSEIMRRAGLLEILTGEVPKDALERATAFREEINEIVRLKTPTRQNGKHPDDKRYAIRMCIAIIRAYGLLGPTVQSNLSERSIGAAIRRRHKEWELERGTPKETPRSIYLALKCSGDLGKLDNYIQEVSHSKHAKKLST